MKANKKGISLIVLIITIVVIIILAAAIILNLGKTNIISNANTAVSESDMKTAQEAFTIWMGDRWVQNTYEIGAKYSGTVTEDESVLVYTMDGNAVENNQVKVTVDSLGLGNDVTSVKIEDNVITELKK